MPPAGGSATESGIVFQENIVCYFATLILAEKNSILPFTLGNGVYPTALFVESSSPVDDILVDTSEGGRLYIQSKTSISLSDDPASQLSKVIGQFVSQYIGGYVSPSLSRPLQSNKDRLVLAVSHTAPNTISEQLRSVLDKIRTASSSQQLSTYLGNLNDNETSALIKFRKLISHWWTAIKKETITPETELEILHLIEILAFDFRGGGNAAQNIESLLKQAIVSNQSDVQNAHNGIIAFCRALGPRRVGADITVLRNELQRLGIDIESVSSYRVDIEKLRTHSDSQLSYLKTQATIQIGGQPLEIDRPVVSELLNFVNVGDVAVIGEPGAGKSGCLYYFASKLSLQSIDTVVLAADMVNLTSPETFARDLNLTPGHTLPDVLANWSGKERGVLIIDALDAARTDFNLKVLCEVLRLVRQKAPRWRTVVSIREYDLRTNLDIQKLFVGNPNREFSNSLFPRVRHIQVQRLSSDELDQVVATSNDLRKLLESASPKLKELLRNIFNLQLLCQLIENNVPTSDLEKVRAQVDLLDLYWRSRVEKEDRTGRTVILEQLVSKLVELRSLHINRRNLTEEISRNPSSFDGLLKDGVTIDIRSADSSEVIGFAHNILFDYAVARHWLGFIDDSIIAELSKDESADLLIVIRPSIVLAFERLWWLEQSHHLFWQRSLAFSSSQGIRLIGKIIPAGVAAENFRKVTDFELLLKEIESHVEHAVSLLNYIANAISTLQEANPEKFPIWGSGAPEWLQFASLLIPKIEVTAIAIHVLIWPLGRRSEGITPEQSLAANAAAAALVGYGLSNTQAAHFVRMSLEVAAKTIASNPQNTAVELKKILEPSQLDLHGHEWLHPLTENIKFIVAVDQELALQIVSVAFTATASRSDQVPTGGRIMALSFNKHDLYSMCRRDIEKAFPDVLSKFPVIGTRIAIKVFQIIVANEHSKFDKAKITYDFSFRGSKSKLRPDGSYIWATGRYGRHDSEYGILDSFSEGLVEIAKSQETEKLDQILDVLRDENDLAIIWVQLLESATKEPKFLSAAVAELLTCIGFLTQPDTRTAAGQAINSIFRELTQSERSSIEAAIANIPKEMPNDEFKESRRDRMLGCIPLELIQNQELLLIRSALDSKGGAPPNKPDFSISFGSDVGGDDDTWLLKHQGIDPKELKNEELLRLRGEIRAIPSRSESITLEAKEAESRYFSVLENFKTAIENAVTQGADPQLILSSQDYLVGACAVLAGVKGLRRDDKFAQFIYAILHEGSMSTQPVYREEDDEQWDSGGLAWGSAARIDSAQGLMQMASRAELVSDEILKDLERLIQDPVPAVRFQILAHLRFIYRTAPEAMWKFMEFCANSEERIGILSCFLKQDVASLPMHELRLEQAVRKIYRRVKKRDLAGDVKGAVAVFHLRRVIWKKNRLSTRYIKTFIRKPLVYGDEINALIVNFRDLLSFQNEKKTPEECREVREYSFNVLIEILKSVQDELSQLNRQYGNTPSDKIPESITKQFELLLRLVNDIALEVYFASGAFEGKHPNINEESQPPGIKERRQFFLEGNALLNLLCDIEFVGAAFNVIQTLEYFVEIDRRSTLLMIARLVRRATKDGIQYESLAADVVVKIVEVYLSDHSALFKNDREARNALLDILDVFVEAGWPNATRLTYRLGEIFR